MERPEYQPIDPEYQIENYNAFVPQRWANLFPDLFQTKEKAFAHLQNALVASEEHKIHIETERKGWSVARHEYKKKPNAIMGSELNRYEQEHFLTVADDISMQDIRLILAGVLKVAKDNGVTQSKIVSEIEDKYGMRGFRKSKLNDIFAAVNVEHKIKFRY